MNYPWIEEDEVMSEGDISPYNSMEEDEEDDEMVQRLFKEMEGFIDEDDDAALAAAAALIDHRDSDEQLRMLQMVRDVRVGNAGAGGGFASWPSNSAGGESSSAAAAAVAAALENDSRDYQHKRLKFHSTPIFDNRQFATSTSSNSGKSNKQIDYGDFDNIPGPSLRYNNDSCYDSLALMNSSEENNMDSSIANDSEGNNDDISNVEDLVNRMDLTDDLLHMVFSFLDHSNLCKAARVCRQWRAASAHEDFWKFLNFEDRNITVQQFEDMCRRYPNATALSISDSAMHLLVMRAISSLRNLEVLILGRGQILDNFFHALADCTMLRKLNINDATLGNGMQEISIYHDRLCQLQLTKCRVMRVSVRCPLLETMSLKRSSMAQVVVNCPLLRELDIGSCHKLPDAVIRSAATSCPQLMSLDMSNCSCVSDETLREISQNCANLSVLDASYCPNISLELPNTCLLPSPIIT